MYYIQTEAAFDAAHFLMGYEGKCRNIHGHRWRIVAELESEKLITTGVTRGMVCDFGDIKSDLRALADHFDHALLIEVGTLKAKTVEALEEEGFRLIFLPFRTTAENFAAYFYSELKKKGYRVARVSVYETPENCAVYTGEKEAPHIVRL